jgi:hypothetical protein
MARELAWLALALAHGLLLLPCLSKVHRGDFPPDFLFGTSTSAYQVRCRLHTYMNQPCLILLPFQSKYGTGDLNQCKSTAESLPVINC